MSTNFHAMETIYDCFNIKKINYLLALKFLHTFEKIIYIARTASEYFTEYTQEVKS